MNIEPKLHKLIKEVYEDLKEMHPKDGLHSPRDLKLVNEINTQAAILDHLQDAMRVLNPQYEIRN